MKKVKMLLAMCVVALAAGCATLGMEPAKSFQEQLAYGYNTVTTVRNVAADAITAGKINFSEAQLVIVKTDEARAGLDIARNASTAGDVATAEGRLKVAMSVLSDTQQFLATKGVK